MLINVFNNKLSDENSLDMYLRLSSRVWLFTTDDLKSLNVELEIDRHNHLTSQCKLALAQYWTCIYMVLKEKYIQLQVTNNLATSGLNNKGMYFFFPCKRSLELVVQRLFQQFHHLRVLGQFLLNYIDLLPYCYKSARVALSFLSF